jgi:hypothetical protein
MGFCQPSSYLCRRCLAAASAVRASEALFSIMPINLRSDLDFFR